MCLLTNDFVVHLARLGGGHRQAPRDKVVAANPSLTVTTSYLLPSVSTSCFRMMSMVLGLRRLSATYGIKGYDAP